MLAATFLPWAALLLPLVTAQANLRLLHRVYHPTADLTPFTQRGVLSFASGNAAFRPSQSLAHELRQFAHILADANVDSDGALYQVALERAEDASEGNWAISSVKVCHLAQTTGEYIILHTTSHELVKPYALDYFVSPIPHDGSCPRKHKRKANSPQTETGSSSPLLSLADRVDRLNTTVTIQSSRVPPLPLLRNAPVLTPTGEVHVPPPEKSFIQKYWLYIAAIVVAFVFSGGSAEEEPRRAA